MLEETKVVYWAPSVVWNISDEDELIIQNFLFKGNYNKLFPEFYFYTQKGIKLSELIEKFSTFNQKKLLNFIEKLFQRKILLDGVQDSDEIFFAQNRLFKEHNVYDESVRFDAGKLEEYKEEVLTRKENNIKNIVKLNKHINISKAFKNRKSVRNFKIDEVISFDKFSDFISILKQRVKGKERKYYYPSAGGLYPIDTYIYVKENRVEGIKEGLYYYSPLLNELELLNVPEDMDEEFHYYLNKEIFRTSAFTVFFFYNTLASMPKYGGNGYYYSILDCGIMIELLTMQAESLGLGCCSIGAINNRKIEHNFNLDGNKKYLHCIEFGIEK